MLAGLRVEGRDVSWEELLHVAAKEGRYANLPYLLLKAIHTYASEEHDAISVTALTGCLRSAYLRRTTDYYEEPGKYLTMMMGTFMHHLIEAEQEEDYLCEVKVRWTTEDVSVSGRIDQLDLKRCVITDYKTARRVEVAKLPYGNHALQVNCYRFLLQHNELAPRLQANALQLVYLDLTGPGVDHNGIHICPIEVMRDDEIGAFITARALALHAAFTSGVPPKSTGQRWLCNYCAVADRCR